MIIGIPKETHPGEQRVAFIPLSVDRLVKKGAQVIIEAGLGTSIGISDEEYKKAGATTENKRQTLLSCADIILRLRKPPAEVDSPGPVSRPSSVDGVSSGPGSCGPVV